MLADQSEVPADSMILEGFGLDDLDPASLQQYRNRFSAREPQHPWLSEDIKGLHIKLGSWRTDRQSKLEGLTVAGLLMFGKDEAIRDPSALPQYQVDYRENVTDDLDWTNIAPVDLDGFTRFVVGVLVAIGVAHQAFFSTTLVPLLKK